MTNINAQVVIAAVALTVITVIHCLRGQGKGGKAVNFGGRTNANTKSDSINRLREKLKGTRAEHTRKLDAT
jgi:hypothetical protein